MVKLLRILSPTITWLEERGSIDAPDVPADHLEAIKQLERIGVVHKRNNRCYELQRIRLKKLMGSMGIDSLAQFNVPLPQPPVVPQVPTAQPATMIPPMQTAVVTGPSGIPLIPTPVIPGQNPNQQIGQAAAVSAAVPPIVQTQPQPQATPHPAIAPQVNAVIMPGPAEALITGELN
jgi:hypothetical protein